MGGKKHEKRFNFLKYSIESGKCASCEKIPLNSVYKNASLAFQGAGNPSDELQHYQDTVNLSNNFASSLTLTSGPMATGIHTPATPEGYPAAKAALAPAPPTQYTYQTGFAPPPAVPCATAPAYYPPVQQQQQQVPAYPAGPYQGQAYYQHAQGEYYPQEGGYYGYAVEQPQQQQQQPYPYAPTAYQQPYYPATGVAESKSTETGSVMSTVSYNSKINNNNSSSSVVSPADQSVSNIVPTHPFAFPPPRVTGGPPPDLLMCTPAVQPQVYSLKKKGEPGMRRNNGLQVPAPKKAGPRLPQRDGDGGSQGNGGDGSAASAHSGKMGESESGTSSASGEIRCEVCQVSVNSSHQLQAHLAGTTNNNKKRFQRLHVSDASSLFQVTNTGSGASGEGSTQCSP